MDIPALSMAMAQSSLQVDVGTAVLSNSMNFAEDMGEIITQTMMEQSVNPEIGSNIDISV